MSSRAFVLLCALAVMLASTSAVAAGPPIAVGGGVPGFLTGDSVFGSASFQSQFDSPVELAIDASSDPDGSNPQGTVVFTATFLFGGERTLHGDVSQGCMITSGNEVGVVGKIPPEEQWFVEGFGTVEYAYGRVVDNGNAFREPVDLATAHGLRESSKLIVCAGTPRGELQELDSGDFTVIDN